jgi:hypothetical protein
MLTKGSTAMAGRSVGGNGSLGDAFADGISASFAADWARSLTVATLIGVLSIDAMNWNPRPRIVRI